MAIEEAFKIEFSDSVYPDIPSTVELRIIPTISKVRNFEGEEGDPLYIDREDVTLELDLGLNVLIMKIPSGDGSQKNPEDPNPLIQISSALDQLGSAEASTTVVLEEYARDDFERIIEDLTTITVDFIQVQLEANPVEFTPEAIDNINAGITELVEDYFAPSLVAQQDLLPAIIDVYKVFFPLGVSPFYNPSATSLVSGENAGSLRTAIVDAFKDDYYTSRYNNFIANAVGNIGTIVADPDNIDYGATAENIAAGIQADRTQPSEITDALFEVLNWKTLVKEKLYSLEEKARLSPVIAKLTVAPLSPNEGDRYIVSDNTGDWSLATINEIATYTSGAWVFVRPSVGDATFVVNDNALVIFDGTEWQLADSGAVSN